MSFLGIYAGTERIEMGADEKGTQFYVEVKRCLSRNDEAYCQKLLTQIRVTDGSMSGDLNSTDYLNERVIRSIVDWNLTDLNEQPLAVSRENILGLPEPAFTTISQRVQELNAPRTKAEEVTFPDGVPSGHQNGQGSPADHAAVRDGSAVVQPTGSVAPGTN